MTSSTASAIAQKFVVQLAQAGLVCAISVATDQLIKRVISLVLDTLESDFEKMVRDSASYQTSENRIKESMGKLYDKFGEVQARLIIDQVIQENAQDRNSSFVNIFAGKVTETVQKLSGSLGVAAGQLKQSGSTTAALIASIAEISSYVATGADIANKFRDIASMTPEILDSLEKSLQRAENKSASVQTTVTDPDATAKKAQFCNELLKKQTTVIISEIKQFIKSSIMQPGAQALLQMAVKPVKEKLNNDLIESLQKMEASLPRSTLAEEDITQLAEFAAAENQEDQQAEKANRSPAGVKHASTPASFTQKTSHQPAHKSHTQPKQVDANEVTPDQPGSQSNPQLDLLADSAATLVGRGYSCAQMVGGGVGFFGALALDTTGLGAIPGAALGVYSFDQLMTGFDGCVFGNMHDSGLFSAVKQNFPSAGRELEFMMNAAPMLFPGAHMNFSHQKVSSSIKDFMALGGLTLNTMNASFHAPRYHLNHTPVRGELHAPGFLIDLVPNGKINFSQGSANLHTSDGRSVPGMADSIRANGWDFSRGVPEAVRLPDGRVLSMNNRSAAAASLSQTPLVPMNVHGYNERLAPAFRHSQAEFFKAPVDYTDLTSGRTHWEGDVPKTYGDAAVNRSLDQQVNRGMTFFPMHGSSELPKFYGPGSRDFGAYMEWQKQHQPLNQVRK